MDKFEALVSSLPFADDIKEQLKTADELGEVVKTAFEGYEKSQAEQVKELLKQNPEFTKQFYNNGVKDTEGKIKGTIENQFKAVFGDLVELEDEQGKRPYSVLFKEAREKLGQKPKEGSEDFHAKLMEKNRMIEELKKQAEEQISSLKSTYESQLSRVKALEKLKHFIPSGAKLPVKEHNAIKLTADYLDCSFKWGFDDQKGFYIQNLDGSPVTNEAGTKAVDPSEIVVGIMKREGLLVENNGTPGTGPKTTITDNGNPNAPGLDALEAHIRTLEQQVKR